MRTTNGNQKILAFQQKHLLKLHLVTPHREERKPFSTHKSERQTALSRAKCFSDGGDVWNIPHQLGQCSQFPTCTMPITAGLSRLPALLFHCAQQDDGFVMQMKVDWKPLHWCCSWPPAPFFFLLWDPGSPWWKIYSFLLYLLLGTITRYLLLCRDLLYGAEWPKESKTKRTK